MLVRICPDCNHHNQAKAWYCSQCGSTLSEKTIVEVSSIKTDAESNDQITKSDELDLSKSIPSEEINSLPNDKPYAKMTFLLDDLYWFFSVPYKMRESKEYFQRKLLPGENQFNKLLILLLCNSAFPIITLFLIYSATPYWPPLFKDLRYLPFDIGWFILISTSFLIGSTAHFLVFRIFSGKGNLVAHAFINALSSTSTILVSILAFIILFIIRIEGIDLFVMIVGGIYLSVAAFLSLSWLHQLSKMRTLVAIIVSGISSGPLFIGNIWSIAKLREYRPFQFDDWGLWIGGILLLMADLVILTHIRQEANSISDHLTGVPIRLTTRKLALNKKLKLSLILSGFLIVLFLGFYFYPHPVGAFVVEDDSILHLNMMVADADYSASLNRIVMLEKDTRQLHLLDPGTKEINSIKLPSTGKSVEVSQDGTHAVVGTLFEIVYLDLETGQVIQQFPANYRETDVAIQNDQIYALSGKDKDHLSQLEVINASTGYRQEYEQLLNISHFIKLQPNHPFLYGYAKGYSALVKIDISEFEPSILYQKTGFSSLENLWFFNNGIFIITSDADIFSTSTDQDQDMKFITHLEDLSSPLGGVAYIDNKSEVVVASNSSELLIFDSETFEKKREILLPGFQVDIWRKNWPFVIRKTYESHSRFLFCNENNYQCYTIVQAQISIPIPQKDDYGLVISDIP